MLRYILRVRLASSGNYTTFIARASGPMAAMGRVIAHLAAAGDAVLDEARPQIRSAPSDVQLVGAHDLDQAA